jgi:uncharacterized protein YcaQ
MPLTRSIDATTARRFLVRHHLLAEPRSLPAGPDGVMAAFSQLGSVQFDPLAVAGRNHDLVLHARVRDYDPAWTDDLLYNQRRLIELLNKALCLLPAGELPWYRIQWDRAANDPYIVAQHARQDTMEHVLERIRAEGPLSTLDFERRQAVDWYWGPTNEIRAAMEALWEVGVLGLARRDGNRRYYDLVERLYPAELLAHRPPQREQFRHRLLSRYRAHGLLGATGPAELWYGTGRARRRPTDPPDAVIRSELLGELVDARELVPVEVEGVRGSRFVLRDEMPLLSSPPTDPPAVTFLAPLDPLAWDRDLLRQLFGFDYLWEVYVPAAKRRWGYYVLPILFGDRLVGRIEPRIDRTAGVVRILGLWWEPGFDPARAEGLVPALREALAAYLRFGRARSIEWAPHLGRQRRFLGRVRAAA